MKRSYKQNSVTWVSIDVSRLPHNYPHDSALAGRYSIKAECNIQTPEHCDGAYRTPAQKHHLSTCNRWSPLVAGADGVNETMTTKRAHDYLEIVESDLKRLLVDVGAIDENISESDWAGIIAEAFIDAGTKIDVLSL